MLRTTHRGVNVNFKNEKLMLQTIGFCSVIPAVLGLLTRAILGNCHSTFRGLLFHVVTDLPKLNSSHVSDKIFLEVLQKLKVNKVDVLKIEDLESSKRYTLGQNTAITFDDGYESIFTHALPHLESLHMKSSIFIVTSFLDKKSKWDVFTNNKHLSKDQVKELSKLGHEIGSHTVTHPNLTFLPDKCVRTELNDSKKFIEDLIGKQVNSLSFPHGSWDKRVWDIAREVGYLNGSVYRHSGDLPSGLYSVFGAYRFDSAQDIVDRVTTKTNSLSLARARLMSHFAKGTPIWKFRKEYVKI